MSGARAFDALLEKHPGLGWTIAHLPFDPAEAWPGKVRLRVKGSLNGIPLQTSLFHDRGRHGYFLLVNRRLLGEAGVTVGEAVSIVLEPDMEPRPAELPQQLDALLDDEKDLRTWYESLSEYTRREIGKWVLDVASEEARLRRARQMAERMFYTMQAEQELPPAVMKALRARPRAQAGWARMTPTQRRMELFAVAFYQTPEAREKRLAKLCDEAEKRAPHSGSKR